MKKFFPFLMIAFIGLFVMSCDNRNDVISNPQDNDTYSVVIDIKNANFQLVNNNYVLKRTFQNQLFDSDVVLIYRQGGTDAGNPVWQLIPRTLYLPQNQELDYDFDFTKKDVNIYADGTYDLATTPQYINNQTFRVVIVPASFKNANIDFNDYNSVIKHFNINDSNPSKL